VRPRADYGARVPAAPGGRVAQVDPDSPAARAGLVPGDTVLSADGHTLADVLDWQWHADGPEVALRVLGEDATEHDVRLEREPGETWGLGFAEALFDGVRTCRNRCAFCFMTQLPRGLRPALYLRDDDFRLSFLQGNFVSLTNLTDEDVDRIAEQHLSPLYVSLHAVSPDVRHELVCAREDRTLERIDELLEAGIDLHIQIVLVPGLNDGEELQRSLRWLAEGEGVESVGIVPLGYTGHQERFGRSYETPADAAEVIASVEIWQHAMREAYGTTWVHLADEFYLTAGLPLPPAEHYDGFPQYENGIGIARSFLDEAAELAEDLRVAAIALCAAERRVVVVSGAIAAPVLAGVLDAVGAPEALRVLGVANRFFGGNVGVAGLLTASDLVAAIAKDADAGAVYLVPDTVLNADGLTLDDVDGSILAERAGADVRLVSSDAAGLLGGLHDALAEPDARPHT